MTMTKKQCKICKKLGWQISCDGNEIMLQKFSPAGEDFFFYADKHNFANSVAEYAEDFDADEHAEMWVEIRGKHGVPRSIRTLINDADAIKKMLTELSEQINNISRR